MQGGRPLTLKRTVNNPKAPYGGEETFVRTPSRIDQQEDVQEAWYVLSKHTVWHACVSVMNHRTSIVSVIYKPVHVLVVIIFSGFCKHCVVV